MNVFVERGITHLDLHTVRHHDAEEQVLDFVYEYQEDISLIIIFGYSNRMINITKFFLNQDMGLLE